MSTGGKVVLVFAAVGAAGLLLVIVGVIATGAFFWQVKKTEQQEVSARKAELEAHTEVIKRAAEAKGDSLEVRRTRAVEKGAEALLKEQAPTARGPKAPSASQPSAPMPCSKPA